MTTVDVGRRRFLLSGAIAACALPAMTNAGELEDESRLFGQLSALVGPARVALGRKEFDKAIPRLWEARDIVEAVAATHWPFRSY